MIIDKEHPGLKVNVIQSWNDCIALQHHISCHGTGNLLEVDQWDAYLWKDTLWPEATILRFSHQENLAFAHRADWYAVARFMYLWGERIGVRSLPMIPPMPQPNPNLLSPQKHINSDWVWVHSQGGGLHKFTNKCKKSSVWMYNWSSIYIVLTSFCLSQTFQFIFAWSRSHHHYQGRGLL